MKPTILASLLLLLLAAPILAQDQDPPITERREAAITQLVSDLETLAAWCGENKLFAIQHACCSLILEFRPDHREARRTLRYFRQGDGSWGRRPYKPPSNYDDELEPEGLARIKAVRKKFVNALLDIVRDPGVGGRTEVWEETVKTILKVDPENSEARALNGETRMGGEWVLVETARSIERSKLLKGNAKEILDAIKDPKKISPTDEERKLGVSWKSAYQGELWRGVGTIPGSELERAVRTLDAAHGVFDMVFGTKSTRHKGCGFYLLTGKKQAKIVLEHHPAFTPDQREYLIGLSAAVVPRTRIFFQWSDSANLRLDGSARMALGMLVMQNFGINTKRGWVWEGLGLYLDYLLTGSRRTFFVTKSTRTTTERAPKIDIEGRIRSAGANWLAIAREMLDEGSEPDLREMGAKEVMDLAPEDLVYSYAFAAFIVEGHPDLACQFFTVHGNREPLADTVEKVFRVPFDDFRKKFERWLRERT